MLSTHLPTTSNYNLNPLYLPTFSVVPLSVPVHWPPLPSNNNPTEPQQINSATTTIRVVLRGHVDESAVSMLRSCLSIVGDRKSFLVEWSLCLFSGAEFVRADWETELDALTDIFRAGKLFWRLTNEEFVSGQKFKETNVIWILTFK